MEQSTIDGYQRQHLNHSQRLLKTHLFNQSFQSLTNHVVCLRLWFAVMTTGLRRVTNTLIIELFNDSLLCRNCHSAAIAVCMVAEVFTYSDNYYIRLSTEIKRLRFCLKHTANLSYDSTPVICNWWTGFTCVVQCPGFIDLIWFDLIWFDCMGIRQ